MVDVFSSFVVLLMCAQRSSGFHVRSLALVYFLVLDHMPLIPVLSFADTHFRVVVGSIVDTHSSSVFRLVIVAT